MPRSVLAMKMNDYDNLTNWLSSEEGQDKGRNGFLTVHSRTLQQVIQFYTATLKRDMERGFGLGISEKDRYIIELRKSGVNPEGVVSLSSLNMCRQNLGDLGLIEEIIEEGARPRTYLVITDKGRRVVQKIREIQEILEEGE